MKPDPSLIIHHPNLDPGIANTSSPTPETGSAPVVSVFRTVRFPLAGGCQCDAVRYTLNAAARGVVHCHCSICRKIHGALSVAYAMSSANT